MCIVKSVDEKMKKNIPDIGIPMKKKFVKKFRLNHEIENLLLVVASKIMVEFIKKIERVT